ncbi:MAG: class I tRNA ligase family protein [Candidatus Nomurabacteria bacterium]|nr:class I tRNA ligase family protein [Candidatus Nomurabacteria bacterium]
MAEKDEKGKSDAALREERVLEFWKENKIFEKSLKQTENGKEYIFYEGPPTANGKPGIHHLEARAFKDVIPRYKTMRGFHVRRKCGWDTHGLPVELQVEKKLGLNSKKAIEEYGVAKFNQECKESVWEYLDIWNKFTKRIGFWLDQEHPYVTYQNNYIESVWNIIKKVNGQKLLYKDYKVVPWCPRCGTALSSHELAQGYEDVKDLSVYVKFRVLGGGTVLSGSLSGSADPALTLGSSACERPRDDSSSADTFFLAWTTTPWTLPGNVALAVGKDIDYVKISAKGGSASGGKIGNEIYILAKARLSVITEPFEIIEEMKGKDLIGFAYEPLFTFLADIISESEPVRNASGITDAGEKPKLEKAYKVYGADFVNTEDGTGIVHTAVMYGQDDFVLGTQIGLPKHHLVGLDGKFLAGTGFLEGRFVKEKDANGKPTLDVDIIKYLTEKNLFFKKENYEHSYPHCWRCHTALIYYARDSWYIRMSDPKIKEKLINENKKINWEPSYIKDGRFGEWLKDVKDWAISRERYWGSPLPVWICESCKKVDVIGSVADLKAKTKKSGNKYFVMRHGEAENNVLDIVSSNPNNTHHLTEKGKKQIEKAAQFLIDKNIDIIFTSTFLRARETSDLIAGIMKFSPQDIRTDSRLIEINDGTFDNKSVKQVYDFFVNNNLDRYDTGCQGGESIVDVKKRVGEFIYEIDQRYQNKNILIITHEDTAWALFSVINGFNKKETTQDKKYDFMLDNAQIRELDFVPIPHNENYELDLHKPYIDEVSLVCARSTSSGQACGGKLIRTKEVMDVWLDSGAMPFAQDHYPFENKKWVEGKGYPADFISEAIDQTRGWFYTLHAIGTLMGRGMAYKNVICLGHLLDASGKKMSKSLGNIVDPWTMIEKYGADTLRLWMYSVNQPGESKNFDEKTVNLLHQQVFGLLYNVLAFYELYRDKNLEKNLTPSPLSLLRRGVGEGSNVLDKWILARLDELTELSTKNLDSYKLLEPVRGIQDFIGDLSTWYLRRSRERIKNGDLEAKATLYFVLKNLAKIIAPFAPFSAEDIWRRLKNENDSESVHLAKWPNMSRTVLDMFGSKKSKVLKNMENVRKIVTLGLEARQKAGIKVRQPLAMLTLKNLDFHELGPSLVELIKDEINVKEVVIDTIISDEAMLDIEITPELKQEGNYRELARAIQDMRKKMGLTPSDRVSLVFETGEEGKKLVQKFETEMKKTILAAEINFGQNNGEEIKVDSLVFKIKIGKIK